MARLPLRPAHGCKHRSPFSGDARELYALVQGINNRGEVLGYSCSDFAGPDYHERIGVWGRDGVFRPYYFETINTSMLVFNERNEIVITNPVGFVTTTSYLVPKPETRIDLATLVDDLPAGLYLSTMQPSTTRGT